MRIMQPMFFKKYAGLSVLALLTIVFIYSCKKTDIEIAPVPAISYQQKIISIPVDEAMIPVRPDSTGGRIEEYSIQPMLPKGISINRINGVISGQASDTLVPTRFVVTASGPGGTDSDTLLLSIGTVGFTYGTTGAFVFEKGTTELTATPLSPTVLAGSFTQYFLTPSAENLTAKTGLTFNSQTGQISGTPTVLTSTSELPTAVTYTVTGISSKNKATTATINITVNDKKPAFTYTFGGSLTVGTAVGNILTPVKLSTSGGIVKYRIAPASPALPDGLKLDSLSGNITGTPTAASTETIVVRGINTGGFQDVNLALTINTTAVAPSVRYVMSLFSGNVVDSLAPSLFSGNTIYLTKNPDAFGAVTVYLNPVLIGGQANTTASAFTNTPAFLTGANNTALTLTGNTGIIFGTPGKFLTDSTPTHNIAIANAVTGGTAGAYVAKIVANTAFFTYNADGGKGVTNPNIYYFVHNEPVNVAKAEFPGYTAAGLSPVGGNGVVNYTILPSNTSSPAFANTGLTFNTTTGAISGTPTTNTANFNNYAFWDYVIQGKKADGSFTLYKIRLKIYKTTAEWSLF